MPKVREIGITGVRSVSSLTPVIEIAHQMRVTGGGLIPVCDNGEFIGVVTETDIVISIVAAARDPVTEPASSIMHNDLPAISPGDDIQRAARLMIDSGHRVLPVVENGELLGLLTLDDFARESPGVAALVFAKSAALQGSSETVHSGKLAARRSAGPVRKRR